MGIVTGYICLILLLLLLVKVLARKLKWNKLNKALMKGHKYIAFLFLVVSIIHFILVLRVLKGRHILVTISGIVILIAGILLTIVCHVVKNHKVEIKFHHFFSLVMGLMLLVHMGMYFVDFRNYLKAIDTIIISEIDLKNVEDGTYIGEYDAVSGATNSSKVIMKACENALSGE
ncbi:MAG: FMN-binding protein [Eubacteriales bacterium]|nr:FMN-binding protein [Eubacteriales bacterium]